MSSTHKRHINHANTRASTGPKTTYGKACAAQNARVHGLAVPVSCDPVLSAEVEAVVHELVGKSARPEVKELTRRVAEAQIDVIRVRRVRQDRIATALGDPNYESRRALRDRAKLALVLARRKGGDFTEDEMVKVLLPVPERPNKYLTIVCDLARRLAVLDRYERRALSRRKFAIRAFDAAGFTWARENNRVSKPSSTTQRSGFCCSSPAPTESKANDAPISTTNAERVRALTQASDIKAGDKLVERSPLDEALAVYLRDLNSYTAKIGELLAKGRIDLKTIFDQGRLLRRVTALAQQFLGSRQFERALHTIDQVLPASPRSADLNIFRGHALMFLGRPEEAKAVYDQFRHVQADIDRLGIDLIIHDFQMMREAGLTHPLMEEIEKLR